MSEKATEFTMWVNSLEDMYIYSINNKLIKYFHNLPLEKFLKRSKQY